MAQFIFHLTLGALTALSLMSQFAMGQEYGALVGIHQTDADADQTGTSVNGKLNFKAGLAVGFGLGDTTKFRTGVLYNQRHIELKAGTSETDIKFDYLDIPANVQYNFNEMFGMFGGLVVAVNVNDDTSPATSGDLDTEKLVPLFDLGVNLTFDDMIGFDFYYERGMGSFADDLENYSSFGANFLYWF